MTAGSLPAMDRSASRLPRYLSMAAVLATGSPALADDIEITVGDCKTGVELVALSLIHI